MKFMKDCLTSAGKCLIGIVFIRVVLDILAGLYCAGWESYVGSLAEYNRTVGSYAVIALIVTAVCVPAVIAFKRGGK